jgi:hypothetical protein
VLRSRQGRGRGETRASTHGRSLARDEPGGVERAGGQHERVYDGIAAVRGARCQSINGRGRGRLARCAERRGAPIGERVSAAIPFAEQSGAHCMSHPSRAASSHERRCERTGVRYLATFPITITALRAVGRKDTKAMRDPPPSCPRGAAVARRAARRSCSVRRGVAPGAARNETWVGCHHPSPRPRAQELWPETGPTPLDPGLAGLGQGRAGLGWAGLCRAGLWAVPGWVLGCALAWALGWALGRTALASRAPAHCAGAGLQLPWLPASKAAAGLGAGACPPADAPPLPPPPAPRRSEER